MDRIVVAFANTEAQHRIVHLLEPNGYGIACVCPTGAEVIRTVRKLGTASVVCGFKLRDMTATELAASLQARRHSWLSPPRFIWTCVRVQTSSS